MCIINSYKVTVASKCSHQTTVKISYYLDMYNILCKNDKLARVILAKIVNPIEKCQTTDYIFFLAPYYCTKICISICYIFLSLQFSLENTIYYQINRKTLLQSSLQQVYYFSQLGHVNIRPTKLESQFYEFSNSRYLIYKFTYIQKVLI